MAPRNKQANRQAILENQESVLISKYTRLNEAIRAPELRVIDAEGKQLGVLSRAEALQMARDQELDLVEISADANPPVAKIVDWGKFNYQRTKQQQKNKRGTKTLELKQMRLGLKIGQHDLEVKMGKVDKFLVIGHKVKVTVFFRGRELAHKDIGFKLADKILNSFGDRIVTDQQPQLTGKQLSFVIRANPSYKPPVVVTHKAEIQTEEQAEVAATAPKKGPSPKTITESEAGSKAKPKTPKTTKKPDTPDTSSEAKQETEK